MSPNDKGFPSSHFCGIQVSRGLLGPQSPGGGTGPGGAASEVAQLGGRWVDAALGGSGELGSPSPGTFPGTL